MAADSGQEDWRAWGPYLSERAWGTVREDYSEDGSAWDYFPHDHARSRAYRWNEDGLAGLCDANQVFCLALGLWNGRDPLVKERVFGLTGPEGNHGEDAKEYWWYMGSTPSHSWMTWRYHYPQLEFPYADLVTENRDHEFLARVFHKLLLNFTWWVNRKDSAGNNVFEGGFLGLDNIGPIDRSAMLPVAARLEQSDGTACWRGPIWFPVNYLVIDALHRYARFFGETSSSSTPPALDARSP
jgi:glycosyl hydrolase family 63